MMHHFHKHPSVMHRDAMFPCVLSLSFMRKSFLSLLCLVLLLTGCSNYARNYAPPKLQAGTLRARQLLSPQQRRAFDGFYLEALRQKYKGNDDAAFDLLDRALLINANDADALFQQGLLMVQAPPYSDSLFRQRGERQLQLAQQLAPQNAHYRETLADYWVQTRHYERALRLYHQIATDDPTPEHLSFLSRLQEETGDLEGALQTLRRQEQVDESTIETTMRKTELLEQLHRIPEAVAVLREWSEAHSDDPYPRLLLAHLYLRNNHLERAREIIDDVAASQPDYSMLPLMRLLYYQKIDDTAAYDRTLAALAADASLAPEKKEDVFDLAAAWTQEGKYDKEKLYQHALTAAKIPGAGVVLGEWLVKLIQNFKLSDKYFTEVAAQIYRDNPSDERALTQLLDAAVKRNDRLAVDTLCQRGRQLHPENGLYYYFGALAAMQAGDKSCVRSILEEGAQKMTAATDSDVASEVFSMLGDHYMHELKLRNRAFAAYDSALVRNPDNASCLNNYAYFLATAGTRLRQAVKMAEHAVAIEPRNPTYLDTYAWALFTAGQYAEAKAVVDTLFAAFRDEGQAQQPDADYYDRAGDIYAKAGFPKEARQAWHAALSLTNDKQLIRRLRQKLRSIY